jgi:hypothetical protein
MRMQLLCVKDLQGNDSSESQEREWRGDRSNWNYELGK